MAGPDSEVLKIADEIGLTASDISSIQGVKRRREVSNTSIYLVESIIGITSFLAGYIIVPIKVMNSESTYPFGSFFLFNPLTVLSISLKRGSIIRLIVLTIFVGFLSFFLGSITGELFNSTSAYIGDSPIKYGVFHDD